LLCAVVNKAVGCAPIDLDWRRIGFIDGEADGVRCAALVIVCWGDYGVGVVNAFVCWGGLGVAAVSDG